MAFDGRHFDLKSDNIYFLYEKIIHAYIYIYTYVYTHEPSHLVTSCLSLNKLLP